MIILVNDYAHRFIVDFKLSTGLIPQDFCSLRCSITARSSQHRSTQCSVTSNASCEGGDNGVKRVRTLIETYHPRVVCSINVQVYKYLTRSSRVTVGLQTQYIPWRDGQGVSRVVVLPSTNGRVTECTLISLCKKVFLSIPGQRESSMDLWYH